MDEIELSLSRLEAWIDQNGYAGYDPYDIKSTKFMTRLIQLGNNYFFFEVIREVIFEFILMFPLLTRKVFGVKKKVNAKALGLLASSYIDLNSLYPDKNYKDKYEEIFNLLEKQVVQLNGGIGWGYPFDWQSAKMIPAFTPNGIVTTAVADAYWKKYKVSDEKRDLDKCVHICEFLYSLPKDAITEDSHCYSYTPLYQNHVHNLNLFVAEFLLKVGLEIGNQDYISDARKAINYTIRNQESNGSFDYNGPPEKPQKFYDNYHTGFVIRMLYSIYKLDLNQHVKNALDHCVDHWKANFFTDEYAPKFTPERLYRIDIHSSAEAINCLSIINEDYPDSMAMAEKIAHWTIAELQDKHGYFYHGIMKSRIYRGTFKSKIAHLRWGQAWMVRALSQFLMVREKNNIGTKV